MDRVFSVSLIRYPHGKFRGGHYHVHAFPPLTTSCFQNNNFLLIEYDF